MKGRFVYKKCKYLVLEERIILTKCMILEILVPVKF